MIPASTIAPAQRFKRIRTSLSMPYHIQLSHLSSTSTTTTFTTTAHKRALVVSHKTSLSHPPSSSRRQLTVAAASATAFKALIFDCDGVIVESEDIHRQAYNAAFTHFDVRCPGDAAFPLDWTSSFYEVLQNKIGGGKPKMKWYFGENGWPTSNVLGGRAPQNEEEQTKLIDTIQDWKTDKYKDIIGSGSISPREGVLELMDQARQAGVPIAVCSASTKQATDFVLPNLLGQDRFSSLDVYMAGDDVPRKKPDPIIYNLTSEKLGVAPGDCLVIEDSLIGLQAAVGAGMRCLITYTGSTEGQEFPGAETVLANLGGVEFSQLINGALIGKDDRKGNSNSGGNGRSGEKVIDGVSVSETPDGTLVFKF